MLCLIERKANFVEAYSLNTVYPVASLTLGLLQKLTVRLQDSEFDQNFLHMVQIVCWTLGVMNMSTHLFCC